MGRTKHGKRGVSGNALLQRRLWGALLALCTVAFFVIAVVLLSAEFGAIPPLSAEVSDLLELIELCAISIFAIELYLRYRETPDKKKFLRQNWLAILAILPVGVFVRSFRAAEGIGLLRPLSGTFRIAEADFIVPAVAVSSRPLLAAQKWLSNIQVFKDFFALARGWAKAIFR
ncbi:MAG: ion transporter [Candidatus Micrarchaeia archaeon]